MAGLVGLVAPSGEPDRVAGRIALSSLCHSQRFVAHEFYYRPPVWLGGVHRGSKPPGFCSDDQGRLLIGCYGAPIGTGARPGPLSCRGILEIVRSRGTEALCDLDGTFVIVVLDLTAGFLRVFTDRIGSLPVHFATYRQATAFAPEAKALFPLLGMKPSLNAESAVSFVNCGYPIGDATQFDRVKLLGPGEVLFIDLRTGAAGVNQYWDLEFDPDDSISLREASENLYQEVISAHSAVSSGTPAAAVRLLLTGGYDSRTVLGALRTVGRLPDSALTWAFRCDLPDSDPSTAKQIAELADVPFTALQYGPSTFPNNVATWCRISELSSDNLGNFAAGPSFLDSACDPDDLVVTGDQMIGPGGLPLDEGDAVAAITKVPRSGLTPGLARVLRETGEAELAGVFQGQIGALLKRCRGRHPKDIHDWLYFHLYVFRWLHAAAYFREPMVTVRRPLMSRGIIELAQKLPRRLRVDKVVLLEMLRSKMPDLSAIPIASSHSLVDWGFESRHDPHLRAWLQTNLEFERVRSTPLGEWIDEGAYRETLRGFFSSNPEPVSRTGSLRARIFSLRRTIGSLPGVASLARRAEPAVKRWFGFGGGSQLYQVLFRLALLTTLQDLVNQGALAPDVGVSISEIGP